VDKARYYQEIAGCYRELGEPRQALAFIDKADSILAGQGEEEKKYRLRFKALGLGPVSFWDLGPDTAVIGENRLFTELDTSSKKILSLSMREEIHFDKGDYARAIRYLKKKLELWGRRDHRINQTGKVRTLNNIGYCYYRMGHFNEALKHFKSAWDYAADPGVNDLEGTFNAMLNYSNLYAMLLERGSRSMGNSEKEIDALIAHEARYKDNYEKVRFENDLETLKLDAKARRQEVKLEDIKALKDAVAESARGVYHHVDLAVGTLKFTSAEHLLRLAPVVAGRSAEDAALDVYRHNRRVYDLYSDALERFRSALEFTEKNQMRKVTARLLLNVASCQKRLGMVDEAYETLSGAEDLADDFAYDDLRWLVYFKTAEFLHEYGARVEGAGHLRLADDYYRKAVGMVVDCPQCYDGMAHLAGGLFDQYARFLVERGDWRNAYGVMEQKYAVNRIMQIAVSSPEFQDMADRESFEKFNSDVRGLLGTRAKISALLESGESPDSDKVVPLRAALEGKAAALRGLSRKLRQENTLFASFLTVPDISPRAIPGAAVFGFADMGGKIYAWSLDGKLEFTELRGDGKKNANEIIRDYLAGKCGDASKSCFVVMNDTASGTIIRQDLKNYPAFTFVPSFERARYYMEPADSGLKRVFYTGKGLARRLGGDGAFSGVPVDEGATSGTDLSKYSIVVDGGEYDSIVGVPALFGRKMSPYLLVRRITPLELDQLNLLAESALYSGIRSLIIYDRLTDDELARVLRTARGKPLDSLNRNADFTGVIPVGHRGHAQPAKK
jgi:tetratricopeptide (TPR) repeat protein